MAEHEASITEGVKGGDGYTRTVETFPLLPSVFNQDLTTFTEVDPNTRITVTSTQASFSALARNEDAYVYKDRGADYFNGEFIGQFDFEITAHGDSGGVVGLWGVANVIDDIQGIINSSEDALSVNAWWNGSTLYLILAEIDGGVAYEVTYAISLNTHYYCTIKRNENLGTYGRLYLRVYSDAARETLLIEKSLALHSSKKDFRYHYAVQSRTGAGATATLTGYGQNYTFLEPGGGAASMGESLGVETEYSSNALSEGARPGESLARSIETQRSISEGAKAGDTEESYITYAMEVDDAKHIHTADSPELEDIILVIEGELDVELPFPTIEARGGARLDVELPFPTIEASAIQGNVGILDVTLPFPTIEATGYYGITATLDEDLPFPSIYARATSGGRFDDYVLRHSRGL